MPEFSLFVKKGFWSFCYVSNEVEGIYGLMMSDYTLPVNIGNPEEHIILEFAEIILRMIGGGSKIVFKELPVDDMKQRRPDIGKVRVLLGWEPKVGLENLWRHDSPGFYK